MSDMDLRGDESSRPDGRDGYDGLRMPELPDNVAIAGRRVGKQYLYRPGELVASNRDLERNSNELFRQLRDDFGAVSISAPPSRLSCRDHALELLDLDPGCEAVTRACELLSHPEGIAGDRQDLLRQRLQEGFRHLQEREQISQDDARRMLERQDLTMFRLPDNGPAVPRVLKALRRGRDRAVTHVWANQVFSSQQDFGWVPAIPAVRLPAPGPESPGRGKAGYGVRVGIVDTGVRTHHAWLTLAEARAVDYDLPDKNRDYLIDIDAGHGSFVAGVLLQQAPNATIVARAALDTDGITDDVRLAAALDTLVDECIDIVNLSVGGPADPLNPAPATRGALNRLRTANPRLTVVAAAGNRNRSDLFYPAAFPDVISVGALDHSLRRASFSNYGPWVNAWALGVDIESCYVGVDVTATVATDPPGALDAARWSGTSFAAPRVAGALAAAMRPGSASA